MRRISLALALASAMAAIGCGGNVSPSAGAAKGVKEGTFNVVIQNGQEINGAANPTLAIKGGYVTSDPAGIDCGEGDTHQACASAFALGKPVTLTAHPATNELLLLGWAGDCQGLNLTCTLTGNADKYVLALFGTEADRTLHPNWADPFTHGHEVVAATLTCTSCHGGTLEGQGLSPSCYSCHQDSAALISAVQSFKAIPAEKQGKVEACELCHASGAYASAAGHALAEQLTVKVSNAAATVSGNDVVITYDLTVNGVPRDDFLRKASAVRNHNEDAYWWYDTATADPVNYTQAAPNDVGPSGVRAKLASAGDFTLVSNGNGNYTATLVGYAQLKANGGKAVTLPVTGGTYMINVMNGTSGLTTTATVVASIGGARAHDLVSDQACINCHGQITRGNMVHDVTVPQGIGPCVVCHSRSGSADPRLPGAGSGLMGLVHGIHNSANMPDRQYTFTWTNGNKFNFSVGFPGNMDNCATCHDGQARLDAVKNAPVSYGTCISCHDSFAAFPKAPSTHLAFAPSQACGTSGCHQGQTVATFHNGLVTERAGLIWDGADQSMVLAPTIKLEITNVAVVASGLEITWTAKNPVNGNAAYDPCNQDYANGPVFFGKSGSSEGCTNTATGCGSNLSFRRAYALGDDWINEDLVGSSSPGQPAGSTKPDLVNTTCDASGVAKTLIPAQTPSALADRGIVALEGKPQVRFAPSNTVVWVRSTTPTREFLLANGAPPATQRRQLVSVEKCNACHPGTLYQHGGSRVDSIELCVMCHNPASSEQNNRAGMGVTAATAYDGKPGETYDLRTMVHAIHAAGENGEPLMYYRSNGIYFFGSQDALARVPNWPSGSDCFSCWDPEDGDLTYCKVHGSSPTGDKPGVDANGVCTAGTASTDGTWRPHRVRLIHYPRALNDCGACHVDGFDSFPSQEQAMAVTFDAGAAPWNVLADDQVIGPTTAACMTCHQSGFADQQAALRGHAYDFSWTPQAFPGSRSELMIPFP